MPSSFSVFIGSIQISNGTSGGPLVVHCHYAGLKNSPMNEAETRAEHIDSALKAAGWGVVDGSRIRREYPITLGRIVSHGKRGKALTLIMSLRIATPNWQWLRRRPGKSR